MKILNDLFNRVAYFAAISCTAQSPSEKIRKELEEKGWAFKSLLSPESYQLAARASAMSGVRAANISNPIVAYNAEGIAIFSDQGSEAERARYRNDLRTAAAQHYLPRQKP